MKPSPKKQPTKRHEAQEPVSTEHYLLLSLSWKIRESLKNNIEPVRIKSYIDWIREHYLEPHFAMEEQYIFPVLGNQNVRVKKALANHRRIRRLFDDTTELFRSLNRLEEELGRYIRFEERTLYNEIQKVATKKQLAEIEKHHQNLKFSDEDWEDKFWVS